MAPTPIEQLKREALAGLGRLDATLANMPPLLDDEPYPGYAPCPCCFESCGFDCEFGNDWEPYVHQTRIPCRECEGTGYVEAEPITLEDCSDHFG